jgi:hypothetical protein
MGTFPINFHILQILQILKNLLGGMPSLSIGVDCHACDPIGGGTEIVDTDYNALSSASCSAAFDDQPSEDFL